MEELNPSAEKQADELTFVGNNNNPTSSHSERLYQPYPLKRPGLTGFNVAEELVVMPELGDTVYALNTTGAAIWHLCDGKHSLQTMFKRLRDEFEGDDLQIMSDLNAALLQFRELDLLEVSSLSDPRATQSGFKLPVANGRDRPRVRIVHGVEDRAYFHWQLAIMFESLVGQMPAAWDIVVVVCNNHQPISPELEQILNTYGVKHHTGESPAENNDIDFAGGGDNYAPMNRVEALNIIRHHSAADDLICLMDTDIFLYGQLQESLFPRSNAMTSNWIIGQEKYFHFATEDERGFSLPKLLEALGYEKEFKPGGVMVFLTGEALQKNDGKLVRDCFRFLQILYLAGKILELPPHGVWVAEMACFALAMHPNEIDYELLDIDQFAVLEPGVNELPEGTFYHYYTDRNDGEASTGPFANSQWHKQLFGQKNFLQADIESFLAGATGAAEQRFMTLAIQARERIYGPAEL